MELSASAAGWFLIPVVPICLHVVWSDLSALKIRNGAVEALGMTYVLMGPFVLPLDMYLWNYSHLLVMLVVGFLLNMGGAMGAGDAKFLAAAAPFVARPDFAAIAYILVAALLGGYVVHRLLKMSPLRNATPNWVSWSSGKRFPMGFPLGTALVVYLALVALGRL